MKRISYKTKQNAVNYLKNHTSKETCKKFKISAPSLYRWKAMVEGAASVTTVDTVEEATLDVVLANMSNDLDQRVKKMIRNSKDSDLPQVVQRANVVARAAEVLALAANEVAPS